MDESEWMVFERPEFRIISDKQFDLAQELIKKNTAKFPVDPATGKRTMARRSEAHILSNLIKCTNCDGGYRRYQRRHSPNGEYYYWWVCSNRHAYGKDRCDAEHIRLEEKDVLSALSLLFDYLEQDRTGFFKVVEDTCKRLIVEHIRQSGSIDLEELESELTDLQAQRERIKTMMKKGLLDIEEGENDMHELNADISRISTIINENDVTAALTDRVKKNLQEFFLTFNEFSFEQGLTNTGLRAVIREIKVISKEELHVYFNVDDTVEGLFFPITIKGEIPTDMLEKIDTKSYGNTYGSGELPFVGVASL